MIRHLTVLYDEACPTCVRARAWVDSQVRLIPIEFVAAGSDEARRRFPTLDHARTLNDITAVGDDGSVYHNERAWIVVLWSLARWRDVADHFASPVRRPLIKLAASGTDRWRRRRKAQIGRTAAYRARYAGASLSPPRGFPPPVPGCADGECVRAR
jgi:predicted DCC family thiol-disulfide oxidoreductase YuxK